MEKISFADFLDLLFLDELKEIAYTLKLDDKGNKKDLITRITLGLKNPLDVLSLLKNSELKEICDEFRLPTGNKDEMIKNILGIIDVEQSIIDEISKPIEFIEPTVDNVIGKLKEIQIDKRKISGRKWGQIFILDISGWRRGFMTFLLKQTESKVKDKDLTLSFSPSFYPAISRSLDVGPESETRSKKGGKQP
jgi:hypothetical protein